jgi:hypothetical protein
VDVLGFRAESFKATAHNRIQVIVSEPERHPLHALHAGTGNRYLTPIAFMVYCSLVYCKYTTWTFLSPESYSLNVQVGNPQLPNYLHSSEDTDKFHRPENKNHEDQFNVRIEGTVPSCKMPRGRLPFVAQE